MQFKGYFHIQLLGLCLPILRDAQERSAIMKFLFPKKCSKEKVSLIKPIFPYMQIAATQLLHAAPYHRVYLLRNGSKNVGSS